MKPSIFSLILLCCATLRVSAQCNLGTLQAINTAGQVLAANMECTDANGWTHYFNTTSNNILLSVKKNGQNIGSVGLGLTVKAGTLSGLGNGGFNLSDADYIANDVWIVGNRFWQVTGANAIFSPVQVRFYFAQTEVSDVAQGVDDFGFFIDEPDDLLAFTISNANGLYPFSTETQPFGASFTLYDMVSGPAPDWASGSLNNFHFAEFQVPTLDIGGGMGFLIFQAAPPVSVSGSISRPSGGFVPAVTVQAASSSIGVTGANGSYFCPALITGTAYEIVPAKDINHTEFISIADLLRLSRHLLGMELFSSPFQFIAGDTDNDAAVSLNDLSELRKLLLGVSTDLPNTSWRFVPKSYVFPNPNNPFSPPFLESIQINNLPDSLFNQDFFGVKIGDVAEDGPFNPNQPNTQFILPHLATCNPSDEIIFPLTVEQFTNLRGFQFTLEWDPAVMEFTGIDGLNLVGLSQQCFGTNAAANGKLTFAWFNPANTGTTLPDGTAICSLHFISAGSINDATPITFTSSITDALLVHQNLTESLPTFSNGNLSIENSSSLSANSDVVHAGCNGEPIGSIDLTVNGGVPPLAYHWNTGATTEDISGLSGGIYQVTVSDNSGGCPKVFFINVAPTGPIEIDAVVSDMTCPSIADGSLQLLIDGGPFSYNWSNGASTPNIGGLFMGAYTVTVTDLAGCTTTASFEVANPNMILPNVSITNSSTETTPDGGVSITTIGGGIPPFTFLWNTGATTQSISGLTPGDYIVTITDAIGCTHVFGYLVNDLMTPAHEAGQLFWANIFPNPIAAGETLTLDLRSEKNLEISLKIFSPTGALISENSFPAAARQQVLQCSAPAVAGIYFLQIQAEGQPLAWAKLLVRH